MGLNLHREAGAMPKLVGQRGACGLAPENTMASFERALTDGADIVELDVRLCADGAVVVLHDEMVDRTTDGEGPASELTLGELKRLDAGAWFGPQYVGERIPTLGEVLDWARVRIGLLIELKYPLSGAFNPDLVPEVLSLVATHRVEGQVAFISYQPRGLAQLRSIDAQYAIGSLLPRDRVLSFGVAVVRRFGSLARLPSVRSILLRPLSYARRWGCDVVAPNIAVVTTPLVEATHAAGLAISCGGPLGTIPSRSRWDWIRYPRMTPA